MVDGILRHFGLMKPYRPERILVLLAVLTLGVGLAAAVVFLLARTGFSLGAPRGLSWDTPRGWMFIYLASLLVGALCLARWPRVAAIFVSLAAIEMGLGFGSAALYELRLTPSAILFPNNYNRPIYGWHPLLQTRPEPTPAGKGGAAKVFINSEHRRGPELSADYLKKRTVVALFGGSTTLDFAVDDGASWPEVLEKLLGPNQYTVINHGVAGYTTAEHLIQTAFYQDAFDTPPQCAVYYIGWNDLSVSNADGLDGGYTNHMRNQLDAFMARRLDHPNISISPSLMLLSRLAMQALDTVRSAPETGTVSAEPDPRLDKFYLNNVRSISAINRLRGVKSIWVGQVMNEAELKGTRVRGWSKFIRDEDTLRLIQRLNGLVEQEAARLGDSYVNISSSDFTASDFWPGDEGHFTPAGSKRFATLLAPAVKRDCPPRPTQDSR